MPSSNANKEEEKAENSDAGSFETAHSVHQLEAKAEVSENSNNEQNCVNGENNQERQFRGQRGGRRRNQLRNSSPEQKPIIAKGLKGTVAWYSVRDCYGFIKRDDGEKDVFVHQMAIAKSYLRQQRYRSLAEGEEVWFDLAKGREERLQAANVTGPEGKHVIGTPIVIHRVGGRNGPRVVGIEEDVGYRRFGRFRRDRRRRAASRDQETQSSAAPDTQVSKQLNEKTTENSVQKQNRSNSINDGAGKTNRRGNHDQHVVEIEDGSGYRRERSGRFRRGRRRYRSPIRNKETRQNSEKSAAQQSKHPQSNGKTPETSAQKQELSSSATNDETVPIRIEVIQE